MTLRVAELLAQRRRRSRRGSAASAAAARGRARRSVVVRHQMSLPDRLATRTRTVRSRPSARRSRRGSRRGSRFLPSGSTSMHVADVDRGLLGDDAAGLGAAAGRADLGVLLDPVDALDQDPLVLGVGRDDLALGAALSLPVMTWTVSPFLIFIAPWSEHLRRQRDDLHEPLVAQLAADRAEDAGAARVAVGLEDDGGVLVEADVRAVRRGGAP